MSPILPIMDPLFANAIHVHLDDFTEEEKARFRNPKTYREFRRMIELDLNSSHKMTEQGQPQQKMIRDTLDKMMRERLATKPEIASQLIPDFPVACKRLTPGPGKDCLASAAFRSIVRLLIIPLLHA